MDDVDMSDETVSISNESELLEEDGETFLTRNCNEKIIFVMDTEYDESSFTSNEKNSFADSLKKSLKMFFVTKSMLSSKHQFALVLLKKDTLEFSQSLTTSIVTIAKKIKDIDINIGKANQTVASVSTDTVIEEILENFNLKSDDDDLILTQPIRFIFVVDANTRHLHGNKDNCFQAFDFVKLTVDFILFGGQLLDDNESNLAQSNISYVHSINKSNRYFIWHSSFLPKEIMETFAKLLAHPWQRCQQQECVYEMVS